MRPIVYVLYINHQQISAAIKHSCIVYLSVLKCKFYRLMINFEVSISFFLNSMRNFLPYPLFNKSINSFNLGPLASFIFV